MYENLCADVNVNLVCTTLCIWLQWCGFTSQWSAPYCTNTFHDVYQRRSGYMVMVVSICFFQYISFSSITLRRFFRFWPLNVPSGSLSSTVNFYFDLFGWKAAAEAILRPACLLVQNLLPDYEAVFGWLAAQGSRVKLYPAFPSHMGDVVNVNISNIFGLF